MSGVGERLRQVAIEVTDSTGEKLALVSLDALCVVAKAAGLSRRDVEIASLRERIVPMRYARNLGTVGWAGQIALLESTVAVVGAGGLGGWVVEGLARMGVGHLIIIDGDLFQESNLNRQSLSTEGNLGKAKVEAARERVAAVNAAVEVIVHQVRADEQQLLELLAGADVVVDALDALPIRLALQRVVEKLRIPLVHGAIAGFVGQVMTILPGDPGLLALFGHNNPPERGMEAQWGNPAATPLMVAAWQIHEVVKLLTGCGEVLRRRMLFMDGETGAIDVLQV